MMKNGHFVILSRREALRPVKIIALDFWGEQMKDCGPQIMFSAAPISQGNSSCS
jgi:hypothetical protein